MFLEARERAERTDWPTRWRWRWTFSRSAAFILMFSAGLIGVGLFRTTTWFLQSPVIFEKRLQRLSL
jgi:hypothetical protein